MKEKKPKSEEKKVNKNETARSESFGYVHTASLINIVITKIFAFRATLILSYLHRFGITAIFIGILFSKRFNHPTRIQSIRVRFLIPAHFYAEHHFSSKSISITGRFFVGLYFFCAADDDACEKVYAPKYILKRWTHVKVQPAWCVYE